MPSYYGRNRRKTYTLSGKIGSGGEGTVYGVVGRNDLVAKIYSNSKLESTINGIDARCYLKEKIETMLDQPVDAYVGGVLTVAWPTDLLMDSSMRFVGYIMPKVKSTHKIFSASRERERKMLFPNYTWKTGIAIAYNLALAVEKVHIANAVVGDMNPNNIMIDDKGHVTLIDTDSFNITNKRTGRIYKCSVGVGEVLPPELQGRDLSKNSSRFSEKTDSFSLSIHVFNLLMNNCHPFGVSGLNTAKSSTSNSPVERNIAQGNCPYVSGKTGVKSKKAPDVRILTPEIRRLFDREFCYDTSTAIRPETIANRPNSTEWKNALKNLYEMTFKTCPNNSSHVYPKYYSGHCPWCSIDATSPSTKRTNTLDDPAVPPKRKIIRSSVPLWLVCIVTGIGGSIAAVPYLLPYLYEKIDISLTLNQSYIIVAIIGLITGCIISYFASFSYETAISVWPYLIGFGILSPILTLIVTVLIGLAIFVVFVVATIVLYIAIIVIALACIIGCLSGM